MQIGNLAMRSSLNYFLLLFSLVRLYVIEPQVLDGNFSSRGAITVLAKVNSAIYSDASKLLVQRNKLIRKYLWVPNKADVIVFHDDNMSTAHQEYIQSCTPDMPIYFIDITTVFTAYRRINNPICPTTIESMHYSPGYHSMCYFWFVSFIEFLDNYQWMLRIDDDCHLISDVRHLIPPIHTNIHLAASRWLELDKFNFDTIAKNKQDGVVVKGLKRFLHKYIRKKSLSIDLVHTWVAPYTNVMYLDLQWAREHTLIRDFIRAVDHSGCIYSNRWGDLPLWGAVLVLTQQPVHFLRVPYEHYSHHMTILASGTFQLHPDQKKKRKRFTIF